MLSFQNAMEKIGFNSNSESRKQLCCSVKLQNCSNFTRFCKLLQDKATTFWKWERVWDWSAPVRNLDCKGTRLLTWVFLSGLKFLWLLQAEGYSLCCLQSLSLCLSHSLILIRNSVLEQRNLFQQKFHLNFSESCNFNTLAFLVELTSSTYDYIYIKIKYPLQ